MLERYALDLASARERAVIEKHLEVCDACRPKLAAIERSLRLLSESLKNEAAVLVETHATPAGIVALAVRPDPTGKWVARVMGPNYHRLAVLNTREEAERHCRSEFREMYSDHRCSTRCRLHRQGARRA